jgi:putative hydrolases of HD superfamily
LGKELGFQHILLQDTLREQSKQQTSLAEYIRDCQTEGINIPVGLMVRILEKKIRDCMKEAEKWCLVQGFPEDLEQLLEFEKRVSISGCLWSLAYTFRSKKLTIPYY